jgi:uncharacterized protein DUF998
MHPNRIQTLLTCGVIAGPLYVVVGLTQALTREGFELNKHAWSLLSNGDLGWIQIANFFITGLLIVAAAVGLRYATDSTWAPALIGVYGLSMVGAGIFRADPAQGFPAGTPETTTVSWHGMLHFMIGGVGFLCLIVGCFVLARRVTPALAWFSRITGVFFLAAFAGIASGSHGPTTLAFVAAVITVFAWLTTISLHFSRALTTTPVNA